MDWSVLTPLVVPTLTVVLGAWLGFIFARLRDKHRKADVVATLSVENDALKSRNSKLETRVTECEKAIDDQETHYKTEIAKLCNRLAEYEDRKRILAKYEFDKSTETLIDATGHRFCPKCMEVNPQVRARLKTSKYGWQCFMCQEVFSDPENPPPKSVPKKPNW